MPTHSWTLGFDEGEEQHDSTESFHYTILLDLVPPPSPIVPLSQRGAFTPSMGGSSGSALHGPPVEVVILDVHPLLSGPSSTLFNVVNG